MIDVIQNIVSELVYDPTLWTLMNPTVTTPAVFPNKAIFTGPIDIVKEGQVTLLMPSIVLTAISESFRTVPQNCRDSRVQLDIWSRNSEAEIQGIYEQIQNLLNYQNPFFNSTRIFWQRSGGARSSYESDVRLWHWSCDFIVWSNTD